MINIPRQTCRSCGTAALKGCAPPDLTGLTEDEQDYFRSLRTEGWRRCTACQEVVHVDTLKALAEGDKAIVMLDAERSRRGLGPFVAEA